MAIASKLTGRRRRQLRVRRKIHGSAQRPRLSVFRSLRHMYVQIIDDEAGKTLVAASTLEPAVQAELKGGTGNADAAREVGRLAGRRAVEKGISQVVFDRAGNRYHGRVRAVAEGAREAGLQF